MADIRSAASGLPYALLAKGDSSYGNVLLEEFEEVLVGHPSKLYGLATQAVRKWLLSLIKCEDLEDLKMGKLDPLKEAEDRNHECWSNPAWMEVKKLIWELPFHVRNDLRKSVMR
jgi:hypothetical protein